MLRKNDRINLNLQKNIFLKRISLHFFSKLEYFLYGWRSLNSEFFVIKKLAGKIKNFLLDYCFSVLFFFNKNYFLSGVKLVLFFLNLVKIIEMNYNFLISSFFVNVIEKEKVILIEKILK